MDSHPSAEPVSDATSSTATAAPTDVIEVAAVLLIDVAGRVLLQLRDDDAPHWPNTWGLPGGHVEPGETPTDAAVRELLEETGLVADRDLVAYEVQHLPHLGRVMHYFYGPTSAAQHDVVLGEGVAMEFTNPGDALNGRTYTPGTIDVLTRFLGSPEYRSITASAASSTDV